MKDFIKTTIINAIIVVPPLVLALLGLPHFAAMYTGIITGMWLGIMSQSY